MRIRISSWAFCLMAVCAVASMAAVAQNGPQPLITQRIDESQLVTLKGNTHPLAQSLTDLGVASSDLVMHRMLLLLNHSSAQDAALTKLLDEQQEKDSSNYHHWLTPNEFGQQFGASLQDIQTVTTWLQAQGFQVTQVSHGQNVIEFSGTAGQVQKAFHTSIHSYLAKDGAHWANASDPQIPAALAPAVVGIESLNNFPRKASNEFTGTYSANEHRMLSKPQFTLGCGTDNAGNPITCYAVSPYDFATIYNVLPLWNAGIDGTGETIAIVGRSNINPQDVTTFRNLFNLPPADANHLQIILNGPDPGIVGDESEADIDVQWSGAVAKNAKIDFVVSESTESTDGIDLSALYVIDNNLAPILSESFGQCELFLGTAGNTFYNDLWQQAAAQGISVFVSTGDDGSAGCDNNQGTVLQPALNGLAISGIASTQFNVAVGGTDFNDFSNPQTYWNSANNLATQASAKGYIPETTWNDSCTNGLFGTIPGFSTNPETNCNNPQAGSFVLTVGGSGGASSCTTSNGSTPSSCTGGYSKPVWQTGNGVPSDGKRDIPDVSLFASNGFVNNFYVICEADVTNGFCSFSNLAGFGGTSVSTPAFAGIMALADQKMAAATGNANFRQGNPNYVLYKLAATKPTAFHDTPSGSTIAMPCRNGSPNCTVNVTGDLYGVLSGYATATGYDLATGLGSVDANALVTNWNTVTFKASATTMTAPTPTSITHGQPVTTTITVAAVPPATGTPTGDVSLLTSSGQSVGRFTLVGGSASATTSSVPGGTQTLVAHYEGDSIFGGSDSAASSSISVTPEASKTTVALEAFNPQTGVQTNPNVTSATYGQSTYLLRTNVTNSSGTLCAPIPLGQSACPTGTVTLTDNGSSLDGGSFTLNSLGYTEDQAINVTGGTHNIQAQYAGDSSFNASSNTDAITIAKATTTVTSFIVPTNTYLNSNGVFLSAAVTAHSFGAEPSGSFTFFSDGTPISAGGSTTASSGVTSGIAAFSQSITASFSSVGTHTITATYSGDGNYSSANSSPATITVGPPLPGISISAAPQPVSAGGNVTLTSVVDATGSGPAITGTVTFINSTTSTPIPGTVSLTPGTDLSGHPNLTANLTFKPLTTDSFQAHYSGDSNYSSASSPPTLIIVNFPTPTVTVSPATVQAGSPATITALVSATVPGPAMTGIVNFMDPFNSSIFPGTVSLTPSTDSNGNPTLQASLTFTPTTNEPFIASYSGDVIYPTAQSAPANITVNGTDFNLTFQSANRAATLGTAAQNVLRISAQSGYNGTIAFTSASCAGLPAEASCSFSPTSVAGAGNTTVSISTALPHARASQQARNAHGSQWWGLTGGAMFGCVFLLGVPKKRRLMSTFAFVFFALLMTSVSCGGGSTSSGGGGGGVTTDPGTPTGTYPVTVTGTDGTHTHSATFNLTVQ
jgi:hypothetical protein